MARKSQKLQFNSDYFKSLLEGKKIAVPEFAGEIGLSKQSMYENIRENSISREYLIKIAKYFQLSNKDFDLLMGKVPLSIFFRREKRVEVEEEKKDKVRGLAEILLKVTKLDPAKKHIPKFDSLGPKELAKEIRRTLNLGKKKILIDELVVTLEDFGLYTYFYPFDHLGINEDSNGKKIRAASIPLDRKWVIFLDTSNELIDSLYDLIHELAHIFSGHDLSIDHSDELEKFCNAVAAEVLTSSEFFTSNLEELKKHFPAPSPRIVGVAESIQAHLGCSFQGLIIALSDSGVIDESIKRYLYAVNRNKKNSAVKLNEYFFAKDGESLSDFWYRALNDSSKSLIYSFFTLLKSAFLEGRATTRLLADGFGIDISSADVLCKKWISENEFSEDELERFKDGPWQSF